MNTIDGSEKIIIAFSSSNKASSIAFILQDFLKCKQKLFSDQTLIPSPWMGIKN